MQVIEIKSIRIANAEIKMLYENWSPQIGLPLRNRCIGYFVDDIHFQTPEDFECDPFELKFIRSNSNETLYITNENKYDRRKNLTGVYLRIVGIQVNNFT